MNEYGYTGLQLYIFIELILVTACFVYSIWLAYWMYGKRDIFPRALTIIAFTELSYNFITVILGLIFKEAIDTFYPDFISQAIKDTTRSFVFAAIWVSAVNLSEKSASVFTRRFNEKTEDDVYNMYKEQNENSEQSEETL